MGKILLVLFSLLLVACAEVSTKNRVIASVSGALKSNELKSQFLKVQDIEIKSINSVDVLNVTKVDENRQRLTIGVHLTIEGNNSCLQKSSKGAVFTEFGYNDVLYSSVMKLKCISSYDPLTEKPELREGTGQVVSIDLPFRADVTQDVLGSFIEGFIVVNNNGKDIANVECKVEPKLECRILHR